MKNYNLKYSLFCILGISLIAFFALLDFKSESEKTFLFIVKLLPKVVTIDIIIIGLFSTFLWKWKIFKGWLVPFPNLNGTWKGFIQTTWIDPQTNERPAPIPAIVTIKQSFFNISCVMRTAEMTSRSIVSDFVLDKENQLKRLVYTYDSNPKQTVKERSPQHCGTMVFDISESPKRQLIGEYWTGRKTTGHIEMNFWK
ncbi:MAG: hypothetical protein LC109_03995, partial [Bacteroidia bacterium]|nr:hypothetical protein [Bacteroidia bacterium]